MKIAILDDNVLLAKSIEKFFLKGGNQVDLYSSRKEFMSVKDLDYDIYILDINLEDGNGLDIARYLRTTVETIAPILMISGDQGLETKLEGFKIGIDDYIVKPFSPLELEARIKSIMKKVKPLTNKNLKYGDIVFDREKRIVIMDHKEVDLSKKEKRIVEYLMQHQDVFISKEVLIEFVWGMEYNEEKIKNTLNVSICKIRKKLGNNFHLNTINSEGYILKNASGLDTKITLDHIITQR